MQITQTKRSKRPKKHTKETKMWSFGDAVTCVWSNPTLSLKINVEGTYNKAGPTSARRMDAAAKQEELRIAINWLFEELDIDHNRSLDIPEFLRGMHLVATTIAHVNDEYNEDKLMGMFHNADANSDFKISHQEFVAHIEELCQNVNREHREILSGIVWCIEHLALDRAKDEAEQQAKDEAQKQCDQDGAKG
eukprot:gnl/MRDRNA2_/MRDRNA2_64685_c0_seq1.p1 gnl/MRDRNA2_/MRDRNA2_64685_c0~~gnl/MRDRNA2_/MRDRNA2_64685_c0_seq1.p1  ORF type:complete len:192 (+),score=35.24 gnl/MRDRNA2_/MRDRNA2_64685_c0_seq1:515-1090(+)